jgi:hypothetical protein
VDSRAGVYITRFRIAMMTVENRRQHVLTFSPDSHVPAFRGLECNRDVTSTEDHFSTVMLT